jgi:hypothetical protein
LRIEADVGGALHKDSVSIEYERNGLKEYRTGSQDSVHTIAFAANALISLMARGALFLKLTPWT